MTYGPRVARGFKIAYPIFQEEEYAKQLLNLAAQFQVLTLRHFKTANVESFVESASNSYLRQDDIIDDLEHLIQSINVAISFEVMKVINSLSKHYTAVKSFIDHSFKQSFAQIAGNTLGAGIPLNINATGALDIEILKKMWVEKNTRLIKGIPADALLKINDAITYAVRGGESTRSLADTLEDIFKFTKKRARIIARDQIAKLKSDISRHNDLSHGLTMYEWSSCRDGAVRPSHQVLEGKICSWLDSTVYKNKAGEKWKKRSSIGGVLEHAGADIMCRCTNIIFQEVEVN